MQDGGNPFEGPRSRPYPLPPLPPIPLQIEPTNGKPRRSQREPGAWCRENGVTPPPGSFEDQNAGAV